MASKGNSLNVARFKKTVPHLDEDNENVIVATVKQLRTLSESAGMHIYEAVEFAYGGTADVMDIQEKLEQVEKAYSEKCADFEVVSKALQEQVQKNNGEPTELDPTVGTEELGDELKRSPKLYAVAGISLIALRYWSYCEWQMPGVGFMAKDLTIAAMNTMTVLAGGCLLMWWCGLTFQKSGLGTVIVKAILMAAGIYVSLGHFLGDMDPHRWTLLAHLQPALLTLTVTAIISISNVAEKSMQLLMSSERGPFLALRSWFL